MRHLENYKKGEINMSGESKKTKGISTSPSEKFKKSILKSWWFWLIIIIFIIVIVSNLGKSGNSTSTPNSPYTGSSASSSSAATSSNALLPAVKIYKAGMYKIGSDMPTGEYVLISNGDMAYVEIAKDSTGQMESIIANDHFKNRSIVTVSDRQYIKLTSCIAYAIADAPRVIDSDGYLPEELYKTGIDMPAGEYKLIPDCSGAYSEMSNDSTNTIDSIVSNNILSGDSYVTVQNGQYLKISGAKLQLN